jgi:hypothetical protein
MCASVKADRSKILDALLAGKTKAELETKLRYVASAVSDSATSLLKWPSEHASGKVKPSLMTNWLFEHWCIATEIIMRTIDLSGCRFFDERKILSNPGKLEKHLNKDLLSKATFGCYAGH